MTGDLVDLVGKRRCYLCKSSVVSMSHNRRQIRFYGLRAYYRCGECKSYSLFPKLNQTEIQNLYSTKYINEVNPKVDSIEQVNVNRFSLLFEYLSKESVRTEKGFLDFGCGATAEVVIFAGELGYKAVGVEVEATTRMEAERSSGKLIIFPTDLQNYTHEFDIIFLGDVIEHLNNPLETLNDIVRVLSPNGHVVIQGPLEGAYTLSNFLLSVKSKVLKKHPQIFRHITYLSQHENPFFKHLISVI